MIIQNSTDIKTEYFLDKNGDPSPIDVQYEKHNINPNGLVQLRNIPSIHTVFNITTKNGINVIKYNKVDKIVNQTDFTVDYPNGLLTFHSSQISKEIQVSYTNAIGRLSISSDRIFTKIDNQGNIVQTLNTLIEEGMEVLSDLEAIGGANKIINELKGYVESVKGLSTTIIEGSNTNNILKRTDETAKTTNNTLNSTVASANNKIQEMTEWVNKNGDVVNLNNRVTTAEGKLNTVDMQLEEISKTSATKDEVNNSINTINLQLEEINDRFERKKQVNISDYGIIGDGVTHCSERIQFLIDALHNKEGGEIFVPSGKYIIDKTLIFYDNVSFKFETGNHKDVKIIPKSNGIYINNFMILINSIDGTTQYKNVSSLSSDNKSYYGVTIDNLVDSNVSNLQIVPGLKGIFLSQANCLFDRITTIGLKHTIELNKNCYLDNIRIENSLFMATEDYAIVKKGEGETLTISNCKVFEGLNVGWKLCDIDKTFNLCINNTINGDINVSNSTFKIDNFHNEIGKVNVKNSTGLISNFTIYKTNDRTVEMTLIDEKQNTINIENGMFIYTPFQHITGETGNENDIAITYKTFSTKNLKRALMKTHGDYSLTGIKIYHSNSSLMSTYNTNPILSTNGNIVGNVVIDKLEYFQSNINSTDIITVSKNANLGYSWNNVTTNLYYTCNIKYGNDTYLMGSNMTNEVSLSSVNVPVEIKLNSNILNFKNAMLRVFRGTSSGSYSAYADIPMVFTGSDIVIYDTGTKLNGFPWINSSNSLSETSVWQDDKIKLLTLFGDNILCYSNGVPKSTNFKKGDRAFMINENKTYYHNGTSFI